MANEQLKDEQALQTPDQDSDEQDGEGMDIAAENDVAEQSPSGFADHDADSFEEDPTSSDEQSDDRRRVSSPERRTRGCN